MQANGLIVRTSQQFAGMGKQGRANGCLAYSGRTESLFKGNIHETSP
jgi:hypothetical protein